MGIGGHCPSSCNIGGALASAAPPPASRAFAVCAAVHSRVVSLLLCRPSLYSYDCCQPTIEHSAAHATHASPQRHRTAISILLVASQRSYLSETYTSICNICSKTDILYSWCITTICVIFGWCLVRTVPTSSEMHAWQQILHHHSPRSKHSSLIIIIISSSSIIIKVFNKISLRN